MCEKMILNIANTPRVISSMNFSSSCTPRKNNFSTANHLQFDTVSFSGKTRPSKTVEYVVSQAFKNLISARNQSGSSLGTYVSKRKGVNLFLQETVLGKEAKLTLSNGVFGDKSYANFKLNRELNKNSSITALDDDMNQVQAARLIKKYI